MERGFNPKSRTYGMKIYFVNEVHVTTSHLTIEPLALMSRIGGIIGVGQALAWVILLCFDKIAIVYAFKKRYNKIKNNDIWFVYNNMVLKKPVEN